MRQIQEAVAIRIHKQLKSHCDCMFTTTNIIMIVHAQTISVIAPKTLQYDYIYMFHLPKPELKLLNGPKFCQFGKHAINIELTAK